MDITVFTIRNKQDGSLIFAQGVIDGGECLSSFELDEKWLTDRDKDSAMSSAWVCRNGKYVFDEEVRHLLNEEYQHVKFGLEKVAIV